MKIIEMARQLLGASPQDAKQKSGKSTLAKLVVLLLCAQLYLSSSANALDGDINQSSIFGSCDVVAISLGAAEVAAVVVQATGSAGVSGGSFWNTGTSTTAPPISPTLLSSCVSGSTASEFTAIAQEGATADSYADQASMSLSFDFRGLTYSYALTGATGTVASLSPNEPFDTPFVTGVSVPADGTYGAGETLEFAVNFSTPVFVDTTVAAPRLFLRVGLGDAVADYVSGSGTNSLLFRYIVASGRNDSDGIEVRFINTLNTSIRDSVGTDVNLTLSGVASTANVLVNTVAPSVILGPLTDTGAGTLTSTITLSAAASRMLLPSDLTVTNGSATLTGSGTSYLATVTPAVSGPVSLQILAGAFTDAGGNPNLASNLVSFDFDGPGPGGLPSASVVAERIQEVVGTVMQSNARVTLQHQPKIARRIDRLEGRTSNSGLISAFGSSIANSGLPFSASVSRDTSTFSYSLLRSRKPQGAAQFTFNPLGRAGHLPVPLVRNTNQNLSTNDQDTASPQTGATNGVLAFSADSTLNLGDQGMQVTHSSDASPNIAQPYDVWVEGAIGRQNISQSEIDYAILHFGADYLVSPDLLIGVGLQIDWSQYVDTDTISATGAFADGMGYLFGPYLTAKLDDRLYLDARLAFGQSNLDVSPLGTFVQDVKTDRLLATLALLGETEWSTYTIRPEVRANYYRETSRAFTDEFGFTVDGVTYETGELEFGPTITKTFELANGMIATPQLSLDGIWTFTGRNDGAEDGIGSVRGLRGRIEAGVDLTTTDGFSLSLGAHYDGIGETNFKAYGASLRVSKNW